MKFKAGPVITIDFETEKIMPRPDFPPKPLGVAVQWPEERWGTYHAWGHDSANNCTWGDGKKIIQRAWTMAKRERIPLLFQNCKFDIDVAETFFDVPRLDWELYEDSMFLAFLKDPHSKNLRLKDIALKLLGVKPEERDEIKEWLIAHGVIAKNAADKVVMEHMKECPGDIVGRYAAGDKRRGWLGDLGRTLKLYTTLLPEINLRGMTEAYDRERRLLPHLIDNERRGVRVDVPRITQDLDTVYLPALKRVTQYIYKRLGKEINLDSNEELADALEAAGMASNFFMTSGGKSGIPKRSVSAESLQQAITDERVFLALGYRSRLATAVNIFMKPWQVIGLRCSGRMHGDWRQVSQSGRNGKKVGARSGRLIMADPNLLNLIKKWTGRGAHGWVYERCLKLLKALNLPPLPLVRIYMLPEKGHVWGRRDYNQQELRLLGHFEDGAIAQAYIDNPRLDIHKFVQDAIEEILGFAIEDREHVKTLNFGMIYGEGIGSIAEKLGVEYDFVKRLRNAQLTALPGLKELNEGIKQWGKDGNAITTWGGREYFAEPSIIINGRTQDFFYKLLNYLIQPSAADVTKEALCRYHEGEHEGQFLVTVYDEINFSVPKGALKREMALARAVMQSVETDVPMLSDGEVGPNWGTMSKFVEPEFDVQQWLAARAA